MEGLVALVVLLVVGTPLVAGIWLIARAVGDRKSLEELKRRLGELETEVAWLTKGREAASLPERAPREATGAASAATPRIVIEQPGPIPAKPAEVPQAAGPGEAFGLSSPLPAQARPAPAPIVPGAPALAGLGVSQTTEHPGNIAALKPAEAGAPPPLPAGKPEAEPVIKPRPAINWEQFMGVKLFAWIGGLALFLGVAFFVKYSFDNNLVSRELRVALGFIAGLGLLVGGVVLSRKDYAALSQTLCATGVVILYAVTFACHSVYQFAFFGLVPTFLLMVLITATAFLLAIRLNALVVAVLGMLGGFLTPVLLSTGQDNPLGLFGYVAILDAGLLLVAVRRRWMFLAALAAAGTVFMQIGWADEFFTSGKYFEGNKVLIALGVLLGFNALYLAGAWWAKRWGQLNWWLAGATLGLAAVALAFTGWFLSFAPLAQRPWLMFSFVFLLDLGVTALVLLEKTAAPAQPLAGLAVFGLLAGWTGNSLRPELLEAGLAFFMLFAIAHSVVPVWLQRRRGVGGLIAWSQVFPPLALVLVLIPIFQLAEVSLVVWPFVLLVDVLAIGLAVLTASLLPVLAVLLLTLTATGALVFKIPVTTMEGLPTLLFLLGAFAVFFAAAGVWLTRRYKPEALASGLKLGDNLALPGNVAAQLPAFSGILPFLLLMMATLRLPLANPSPVFGLGLLLVVLLLGVSRLFWLEWMPAVVLACVAALECAWHFNHFSPAHASLALAWYLGFLAVFALFPFLFWRRPQEGVAPCCDAPSPKLHGSETMPWAAAALAFLPQFLLVHRLVAAAWPNHVMGLLPAAFALPPLVSLVALLKFRPAASRGTPGDAPRLAPLAWFGGVALFFITLIFPIQFERQWLTLGWALEGAALLWLFHRVPHGGLRLAGIGLLAAAFVRLALNPAVLEYHARSATPLFNWYLYAYGTVTVCLFGGAWLLAPPRDEVLGLKAPPLLAGLGIVLAFLLLNIEIADYFSPPGSTLTFQFSGNFPRDMTYSIAWAVFALALLVIGIARKVRALRYAGLGLLSATVLKLFFHNLAQLQQALPHRRADRCRGDCDAGVFCLSTVFCRRQ